MNRRAVGAILLLGALLAGGCSPDEYVAPPPPQGSEVARPAAAADTVAALQEALTGGDAEQAADLGSEPTGAELLSAVADNVRALGLTDVTFRYVTETGRTGDGGTWDGLVAVTWQHDGFDEASSRLEVPFTFADEGSTIAGIGAAGHPLPVWLSGRLTVRRTTQTTVLGAGTAAETARYARWARIAVDEVRRVLGGRPRLVVEVPADTAGLHRALDVGPGEYDAIAAVTAPVDGSRAPGSPVHVFVNPAVYGDLDPVAAQVVMTHEAVHALTGAALAQGAPLWLVEGFADYIALREVDLPITRTAGQIIAEVRKDGAPDQLPSPTDFDTGGGHLGAVYEAAWLVCVTLAERGGRDELVGLYRAVVGGADLGAELQSRYGWTEADLTGAWRARLAALAA